MTLLDAAMRDPVRITRVDGGAGLRRKLSALGFAEGDLVVVVSRAAFRGPLLVEARGARVAVGRGVAGRIGVAPAATRREEP